MAKGSTKGTGQMGKPRPTKLVAHEGHPAGKSPIKPAVLVHGSAGSTGCK